MSSRRAQWLLGMIWFLLGGGLLILVAVQSLLGRWAEMTSEVWEWLLPNISPTLLLIIGALATSEMHKKAGGKVSKRMFWLAALLSIVYLCFVAAPFVLPAFIALSPVDAMQMSALWIGPFQGVVSGLIGVFFLRAAFTLMAPVLRPGMSASTE